MGELCGELADPRGSFPDHSWLEVQEVELWEAGEIPIKGNETAAAGEGKGGEIRVRPEMVGEIWGKRERGKDALDCGGFRELEDDGHGQVGLIDVPDFPVSEWLTLHHGGAGGEAQQTEHGDAAEDDGIGAELVPVMTCRRMMGMIGICEGEPQIDVRKIHQGFVRDCAVTRRWLLVSSSSSIAKRSALLRAGMIGPSTGRK